MLEITKKSTINTNPQAILQAKKFLNTSDRSKVQKWIVNSVRNAGYLGYDPEGGHMLGFDKYIFYVENPSPDKFKVTGVKLQNEPVKEDGQVDEQIIDTEDVSIEDTTRNLVVTKHAIEEAINDFPELFNTKKSEIWIRKSFKNAVLLSDNTVSADGKVRKMYGFENAVFIVESNKDTDTIITIYKVKHQTPAVRNMVKNYLNTELKRMQRKDAQVEKKNSIRIAELQIEKAECQLKIIRTRSEAVKNSCKARISAIEYEISFLEREMFEVKRTKTLIAQDIAYYA